jgi:predicted house-cleaning noncanonical NTP pyrophosphatase (MazG superfamily)
MRVRYDKAVRDRIPEIISASGSTCVVKQLDDDEFLSVLERKLVEEVEEYGVSGSVEELVDLVEIVYRVLELKGVSQEDFERMRDEKALLRGRFDSNTVLVEVGDK